MSEDDPRIMSLLEEILESSCTAEEACRNHPELLPNVRDWLERIQSVGAEIEAIFPPRNQLPNEQSPEPESSADTAAVRASPPVRLGRYDVHEVLGAGGYGTVYLGHDRELDRPVALKVLHVSATGRHPEREQWLQEARRLARLRHPTIVTVYDAGMEGHWAYIVSEHLAGPNLGTWLENHRPTWQEAVQIAAAVADGLAHAHARRVIHRDVKPKNIILMTGTVPVLVDFGLALDEGRAGGPERGFVAGTGRYMSPEQAAGMAHRIDGRTDVYSLGVTMYKMLTGRVPFEAAGSVELLRQVRQDEPQPPRQLVPDVPAILERAVLKALAKKQEDRYLTAADFASALRRTLVGDGAPTSTPMAASSDSARPELQSEYRQVTLLACSCRLLQTPSAGSRLEAEERAEIVATVRGACVQAALEFGGTVLRSDDQETLVCFGFPVAHEDAVARAARAGLNIHRELEVFHQRLEQERQVALDPWVLFHTGTAVVTADPEGVAVVGPVMSDTRELAIRAEPRRVLCSGSSFKQISARFDGAPVDASDGTIVALLGERTASEVGAAEDSRTLTPFVGRETELTVLAERWEQVGRCAGQAVVVVGEAGVGKSRLVNTFAARVGREAGTPGTGGVIIWRCTSQTRASSLHPACEYFEGALGSAATERSDQRLERLVQFLSEVDLARADIVPFLASLLRIPPDERFPSLDLTPLQQREETFRALREWLWVLSRRHPVLFVVEDLHWADPSTMELLGQVAEGCAEERLLLLVTHRPDVQVPFATSDHQTSIPLGRLTLQQVAELVRGKAGRDVSQTVLEEMYDRSDGVPLFAEELTAVLDESGFLDRAPTTAGPVHLPREVPATLQDLIMARVDHTGTAREVAQLAAVVGREFSLPVLGAASLLDERTLVGELKKLINAGLVGQRGVAPRCTYRFKHALVADALYDTLVGTKRRRLHQQVGEAIERSSPETVDGRPEVLAHHFTKAGRTAKAIAYWLAAGAKAHNRFSLGEAASHLTTALELLETLPPSSERDALELQARNRLGTVYMIMRGYSAPEAGPFFERARHLCRTVGDPTQTFTAMWGTWAWRVVRGEFRVCGSLADEAMRFAEELADPGVLMEALFVDGLTALYRGAFTQARESCHRAITRYEDRKRARQWAARTGQNSSVGHRCYLALALWHLGKSDQAARLGREALDLARADDDPSTLLFALHHNAWLGQLRRSRQDVVLAADEMMRTAQKHTSRPTISSRDAPGFAFWRATGQLYAAAGALLDARALDCVPALLDALAGYRALGATLAVPYYLGLLAEAYLAAGVFSEARQTLEEALAISEANDDRAYEAELQRLSGEAALAESADHDAAEQWFAGALRTARGQESLAWELRATTSLTRLRLAQGRGHESRAPLARVVSAFDEIVSTPDLEDARALMHVLG